MSPAWDWPLAGVHPCPGHGLPANVVIPRPRTRLGGRPRCGLCGHRVRQPDGSLPSSRSQAPWTWPVELYDRRQARKVHAAAMLSLHVRKLHDLSRGGHIPDPYLPLDIDTSPAAPGPDWDWPQE